MKPADPLPPSIQAQCQALADRVAKRLLDEAVEREAASAPGATPKEEAA